MITKIRIALLLVLLTSATAHAEKLAPFTAKFELYYKWLHLGSGEYTLQALGEDRYQFSFESDMGILVYSDNRKVRSQFHYEDDLLKPINYRHKRKGTGRDYKESILFKPEDKLINAQFRNETKSVPYDPLIKDGLSVQLQIMLDVRRGKRQFKYQIFEVFGVMQREFTPAGSETISIDDKTYDCVMIEVTRPEKKFKIQMWFAKDLDYLPVQLVHFDNGKKQFSARLSEFSFTQ